MSAEKSLTPDKPVLYVLRARGHTRATSCTQRMDRKYKGKFDQGWDVMREETLARQIKLGVVPAGTKLAPKPEAIKDWNTLTADEKSYLHARWRSSLALASTVTRKSGD
jgi:arylsulfatase